MDENYKMISFFQHINYKSWFCGGFSRVIGKQLIANTFDGRLFDIDLHIVIMIYCIVVQDIHKSFNNCDHKN